MNRLGLPADRTDSKFKSEATSFDIGVARTVYDQCTVEIAVNARKPDDESGLQRYDEQKLRSFSVHTDTPEFKIEDFLADVKRESPKIYAAVLDVDDIEGPVFKSEDLVERLKMVLAKDPFRTIPSSSLAEVENIFVDQLQNLWGEVKKMKKKPVAEIKRALPGLRESSITRLENELGALFRTKQNALRKSKSELRSDRLTRTYVSMKFAGENETRPLASLVQCSFEGSGEHLGVDRLNGVLSPHFELLSPQSYAAEKRLPDESGDPKIRHKRGVATGDQ